MDTVEVEMKAQSAIDLSNLCKSLALRGIDFSFDSTSLCVRVKVPKSVIEGVTFIPPDC